MKLSVNHALGQYDIIIEKGALKNADRYLNLNRRVLIVTDSGVPIEYAKTVAALCKNPTIVTFEQGEQSKNIDTFTYILQALAKGGFTRADCVVAVGGGVCGDMAGFCASCYMRGIDFYNIPTTVLSQVDSSIGGKTAIDFMGYKNIVGAFYQPKCVLIDSNTLNTLPKRQIANGLAEAVKMSLTSDAKLFETFESNNYDIDDIIYRSLLIKKSVVEQDEKETGLRKILNFGHTLAHAIESDNIGNLYHGECVAIGMKYMCSQLVRERLEKVLLNLGLDTNYEIDPQKLIDAIKHDKKASGDKITVVYVETVGEFVMKEIDFNTLLKEIQK